MLGFSQIANKCHIFEDKLSGSKLNDEDLHEDLLLLNLNIQAELESLHAVAETKLQINVDDSKVNN